MGQIRKCAIKLACGLRKVKRRTLIGFNLCLKDENDIKERISN